MWWAFITVLENVTPCNLLNIYQHFGERPHLHTRAFCNPIYFLLQLCSHYPMLSRFCSYQPKEGGSMFPQNVLSFLPDITASHNKTQYSEIIRILSLVISNYVVHSVWISFICMNYRISYDLCLMFYPWSLLSAFFTNFRTPKQHILCNYSFRTILIWNHSVLLYGCT
jgi:hypothetical protein